MTKTRVDINVPEETKKLLNQIIGHELEKDREADRPERARNAILEMVLNKGIRAWQLEADYPGLTRKGANR